MSNIHTYADLPSSDDETSTPFLASHYTNPSSHGSSPPEDSFWSLNIHPSHYQPIHFLFTLLGCPCFIGPPFSRTRLKDYLRLLVTFLFYVSIADIIMFIVELAFCGVKMRLYVIPAPRDTNALIGMGAKVASKVRDGQLWRLIVPVFMHAGVIHLIFNMLVQLSFGLGFERHWGILRMIPIYLIGGVAGNLVSCVTAPMSVSVGASGALLALFGAKFANVICRFASLKPEERMMSLFSLSFIFFFSCMFSFSESVDLGAHTGGFFMGLLLGMILFANHVKNRALRTVSIVGGAVGVFLFFTSFGLLVGFGVGWR